MPQRFPLTYSLPIVSVLLLQSCGDSTSPDVDELAMEISPAIIAMAASRDTTLELRNTGSGPIGPIELLDDAIRNSGGNVVEGPQLALSPRVIPTLNPGDVRVVSLSLTVPDDLPDNALGFINCAMGTVTEGLLRAGCKEGDYVVIQGAGGLGLNATAMAKNMGAHRVIVMDRLENRLQLAEQFGADHTINIEEFNTPETRKRRVMALTNGRGADIGMELVGRAELLVEGIDFLANGGTYIEIGNIVAGPTVDFDPSTLLRGKKIMGSTMYRPSLLPMMMEMMAQNLDRLPFDKIVSNTFPLAEVNAAFEQAEWDNRQTSVTRAVLGP